MVTTNSWLQNNDNAELCIVLAIDGVDLAYCTSDASGIATAWAATDRSTFKNGLFVIGETGHRFEPFAFYLNADSLDFRIVDDEDGTFATTFLGRSSAGNNTWLTSDVDPTDSSLTVHSSSGFASSGTLYVGQETMAYTGKTSTTFTGLTRGKYALFTNGSSNYKRHHGVNSDIQGNQSSVAPNVSDSDACWYNRIVTITVHHKEAGTWSTKANSRLEWVGLLRQIDDNGDGTFRLSAVNYLEILRGKVFRNQYTGYFSRVFVLPETQGLYVNVEYNHSGGTHSYSAETTFAAGTYSMGGIIAAIQDKFNDLLSAATIDDQFSIQLVETPDGPRVYLECKPTDTPNDRIGLVEVGLGVWPYLGFGGVFNDETPLTELDNGKRVWVKKLQWFQAESKFRIAGGYAPAFVPDGATTLGDILIEDTTGDKETLPDVPPIFGNGDMVMSTGTGGGGDRVTDTTTASQLKSTNTQKTTPRGGRSSGSANGRRMDEASSDEGFQQIWFQQGEFGDILLQLMLSTGDNAYNSASDTLPTQMGLAIPVDLIDVESFRTIDVPYILRLSKETSLQDVIEPVLSCYNASIVLRNGKLTVVKPTIEATGANVAVTVSKGMAVGRPRVQYSNELMVNSVSLKYLYGWRLSENAQTQSFVKMSGEDIFDEINVKNAASIYRYGQVKSIEIEATNIQDPGAWRDNVAGPAISYFAHPVIVIERSFNSLAMHVEVGDLCLLSDDYIIDPNTGTRGVTNLPCWLLEKSFDWASGVGRHVFCVTQSHPGARTHDYAPSALVSSYSNPNLTVAANAFVGSAEDDDDVDFFAANDKVVIRELSPSTPSGGQSWSRTISSIAGNVMTLSGGALTGIDTASKTYVVEYEDQSTVAAAQSSAPYIDATADGDSKVWGMTHRIIDPALSTPDGETDWDRMRHVRMHDTDLDAGEPVSTHKPMLWIGNCYNYTRYKSRSVLVSDIEASGNSDKVFYTRTGEATERLAWGPIIVPLTRIAPGTNSSEIADLVVYAYGAGSGTALTVKLYSAYFPPGGGDSSGTGGMALTNLVTDSNANSCTLSFTAFDANDIWKNTTLTPAITWRAGVACTILYATTASEISAGRELKALTVMEG